jgi:transcriptional regulator with XRE-family HTH domain
MSTDISAILVALSGGRDISLSGVNNGREHVEDLAEFVQRVRREKGLSQRDVETKSERGISKGYIGQIENREVLADSVTPQKLRALARGLGVSEDEIFAIARGKPLGPMSPTDFYSALEALGVEQFQAYGGVAKLSDEDRAEIIGVLTAMIEQKLKRKQKTPVPRGSGKK